MSLLVVDHGTNLMPSLLDLLPPETILCLWNDIADYDMNTFEGIILSGGSLFEIEGNESLLINEMVQIKNCKRPTLGICYGMEILVKAYGGTLKKMPLDHQGMIEVQVTDTNTILGNLERFFIYEHHQWKVEMLPSDFIPLAYSVHGYEAIQHRFRPHYGLQFHPEKITETPIGKNIIQTFLSQTKNRQDELLAVV